jgi:hypothetical protein
VSDHGDTLRRITEAARELSGVPGEVPYVRFREELGKLADGRSHSYWTASLDGKLPVVLLMRKGTGSDPEEAARMLYVMVQQLCERVLAKLEE